MGKVSSIYKILMKSGNEGKQKIGSKLLADYHRPAKNIAKQFADGMQGPSINPMLKNARQTMNQVTELPGHMKDIYKAEGYSKSEKLKALLAMLKDNKRGAAAYGAGAAGLGAAGYGAKRAMSDDE